MSASGKSDVVAEIRARAGGARRIVFVCGNFNVVHPGHLRLLKFASDCGDFLAHPYLDPLRIGYARRAAGGRTPAAPARAVRAAVR